MPTDPVRMTNCSLFTHTINFIFQVLHPNVEEDIDSDLELLRTVAYYLDKYEAVRGFRYLNVEGAIDEFSSLLKLQLDLQTEAYNLVRFNENFANVDDVTFPKVRAR